MRRGVFHAVIKGAAGVRRVHITEEKEMTQENVCKSCEYYESCGKPERYIKCMGKPYPEPEKKPASKCGLFCGYYGSTDDYIKQPEEKEVTDSGSNADA